MPNLDESTSTAPFVVFTIASDGTGSRVAWEAPLTDDKCLANLQEAVGGYVEVIAPTAALTVWLNEEGRRSCDPNPVATAVVGSYAHLVPGTTLFGPVVFTGPPNQDGETLPLTDDQVRDLTRRVATFT